MAVEVETVRAVEVPTGSCTDQVLSRNSVESSQVSASPGRCW